MIDCGYPTPKQNFVHTQAYVFNTSVPGVCDRKPIESELAHSWLATWVLLGVVLFLLYLAVWVWLNWQEIFLSALCMNILQLTVQ